jgi:hypothetical protein
MSNNGNQPFTQMTLTRVSEIVKKHYGEDLWLPVKIGLAVIASLSLKGRDNCLVLVYEGGSGQGKSITVRLLMADRPSTEHYLLRVDDFTAASFVSHAANKTTSKLAQIDLLPQLRDKVMLTKELAPLFRDEDKVLRQNFARLTSILDGNGYMTTSGNHGKRGYLGKYIFNWLGATTPIPDRTFGVMAQLGNRMLFCETANQQLSEDRLMQFAQYYGTDDAIKECQTAVNDFIEAHFKANPINRIEPQSIQIPEELRLQIVRYAKLIAHGRVEITYVNTPGQGNPPEMETGTPEGPQRVILLLQILVQGLALADGRTAVIDDGLQAIRHIAFSSIPRKRRELLRALLVAGGSLASAEVEKGLDVSRPTAIKRMKELGATRIAKFIPGNPQTSTPDSIILADEWTWLLGNTPLNKIPGVISWISIGLTPL